ncbi:MAG: hypothetical protein WCP89_03905, partial [archaeon]
MVFSLLLPELSDRPKGTKDAVISILSIKRPLTLREIFYAIKKRYNYSSSYQAVFKAVKEMHSQKVLVKKENKYEISLEWIKRLQSFTDIVETNYYATERMQEFGGVSDSKHAKDIIVLNFNSYFDAEKYLYYFMKSELFKTKGDTICWKLVSEWRPIVDLRSEFNYYKRLRKREHKFHFFSSGNTEIEKECVDFYKKIGICYSKSREKFSNDSLVFGDYFIQIFVPVEVQKSIKEFLVKEDKFGLLGVLSKESLIRVVITKDASLAAELKKQSKV